MLSAAEVLKELQSLANPEKAAFFPRFFKAGPGEYAEGDQFVGVTVPQQRLLAKAYKDLPLGEVKKLLTSPLHEARLTALFILVMQFQKAESDEARKAMFDLYLKHTAYINNWDLVDSSSGYIVGTYLEDRPEKMDVLQKLADSKLLWERRIAMLATFAYIKKGRADEALIIAEQLLNDKHDLMHKAVGWMLREMGKRVDRHLLEQFLNQHAATMPRTTLRYAIEHFSPDRRKHYLNLKSR